MSTPKREPSELGYLGLTARRTGRPAVRWWVMGLAVVAGIVGMILVVNWLEHRHDASPSFVCQCDLRYLGVCCATYAEGHGGHWPSSLNVLTEGGRRALTQPKQLICPVSRQPYNYIPGHTRSDDPNSVVAYESLSNHKGLGANILFLDGSVKWFNAAGYQQVIAKAAQGTRAATQPASAPVPNSQLPASQ
jgi:prepilin-type processing-associated H-X9-DG protein